MQGAFYSTTNSGPMRVASYARVSSAAQAAKGQSIPEQFAQIASFCEARSYQIVAKYEDPGVTGMTMDRPGFQKMLKAGLAGGFDAVAVYDTSRWSRSSEGALVKERLRDAGLRVIFVAQSLGDTEDPFQDEFVEDVLAAGDKAFARKLQKEIPGRMRGALLRGGKGAGGRPPFGYRTVFDLSNGKADSRIAPDPEKAPQVLRAFELYANGASTRDLVHYLQPYGGPSSPVNVSRFLRNVKYAGMAVVGRTSKRKRSGKVKTRYLPREEWTTRDGAHEAIVPRELFDLVQGLLDLRSMGRERTRSQPSVNPFPQGLLRCANCHGVVEWHKSSKPPYPTTWTFMCRGRRNKGAERGAEGCKGSIRVEKVKRATYSHVGWLVEGDNLKRLITNAPKSPNAELVEAARTLRKAISQRDNLIAMVKEAGTSAALIASYKELEERTIPEAERKLAALRAIEPPRPDYSNLITDAYFVVRSLEGLETPQAVHKVRSILTRIFSVIEIDFPAAAESRDLVRKLRSKKTSAPEKASSAFRLATLQSKGEYIRFNFTWDRRAELVARLEASTESLRSLQAASDAQQVATSPQVEVDEEMTKGFGTTGGSIHDVSP
ncbi:MAG TPA: recombinase family protein [Candidatus Cybelea sp.]|jgi:DNA invertase Pin-like site-specific DNA recombinase|nr:recombinase family protein [Candidatus Cybelea sp.]